MGFVVHPHVRRLLNLPHSGTHYSSLAQRSDIKSQSLKSLDAKEDKTRLNLGQNTFSGLNFIVLNSR